MKILGIYGSPRKKGNTDLMMEAFLEGAAQAGGEVERVYVRDLKDIHGCIGCGHCDKEGVCVQKDDMTQIYPMLEGFSRIVVGSPVYFYGVTGQLKLLVDRSQALFMKNHILQSQGASPGPDANRKGFLLSAGATRGKRLFECTVLCIKYFFDAINMTHAGELCVKELDERGAIKNKPEILAECREAGRKFMA